MFATQPFNSIQAFNRLDEAHHMGEGNMLYSVYRFKFSSDSETLSQVHLEIMFKQMPGPVKLTHKINTTGAMAWSAPAQEGPTDFAGVGMWLSAQYHTIHKLEQLLLGLSRGCACGTMHFFAQHVTSN